MTPIRCEWCGAPAVAVRCPREVAGRRCFGKMNSCAGEKCARLTATFHRVHARETHDGHADESIVAMLGRGRAANA